MVREYLNDMPGLGEIMSVLRKGMDDGVEFFVMNIPVLLGGVEFVVEEEERMPSIIVFLFKNAGISLVRRVCGEADGLAGLECSDINIVADVGENAVKGRLVFGSPFPGLVLLGEVGEAGGGVGVVGDEFIIKPDHAKEGAKVGETTGSGKVAYALDFIGGHPDAFAANDVETKEVALLGEPFALVGLEAETVVSEGFENEANVFLVLLERTFGVDDDVIEVRVAEDAEVGVENGVNESLEDGGSGRESHGHDGVFVGSEESFESSGLLGAGGHAEVGEPGADIHGRDPVGTSEVVHKRA